MNHDISFDIDEWSYLILVLQALIVDAAEGDVSTLLHRGKYLST